ncbi:MAG TPA: hypothetical protein VIY90_15030 [Steroidobacteraceae bacterium]
MNAQTKTLRFAGPVKSAPGPGRGGITLLGRLVEADGTTTAAQLSLICGQPLRLPSVLHEVTFEALTTPQIVLRSGTREWRVACGIWQLHRDASAMFYAAIPPRVAPWTRRLAWRVLLGTAATVPGQWLLARRSRAKR